MASYKSIEINDSVRPFLPHMPRVEEYRELLQSLQAVWDNLSLLGQLSGTTTEMGNTRAAFASLTSDLLNNLAEQTLAKRSLEMAAKSQVVIDILVRNLFERTADIGFLATDDDIRRFAAQPGDAALLRDRFREYVRKYSVYDDVVLLSRHGEVLARLQPEAGLARVDENWVRESVTTSAAYVEAYGPSALFPGQAAALIYAYRVTSASGEVIGVLALCFRFADEMSRIFASLSQADDPGVLVLLDGQGCVIASQDRWQVPLGAELPVRRTGTQRLRFAGRNYLAVASETHGYQGYMGPGWRGLVLMPLDQAFEVAEEDRLDVAPELLASVLAGGRAFPETLRAIPYKAEAIQRDLSRSVWNGTVRHSDSSAAGNAAFSKILLWEISRTGMRMREVFSSSIGNLQTTVLSSLLADSRFLAGLAIDIMDRNLYERANDCRWWALDSALRRQMTPGQGEGLGKVLAYINGLYTVYANLLVFDTEGKVLAVSNPDQADLVGQVVHEHWVSNSLKLNGTQAYTVSAFAPTHLYRGRPTYIYAAAIRSLDERQVLGGIGIVFDSTPQFGAMLSDALPRETSGEIVAGSFAVFVDSAGCVVATSDPMREVGSSLDLPPEFFTPPDDGLSSLIAFEGQVMAVGAQHSRGYREYKGVDDAYRNELAALVFVPLGRFDPEASLPNPVEAVATKQQTAASSGITCEIATFYLGNYWLGLPVSAVAEVIELAVAARLANAPKQVYGALIYRDAALPIYNLHAALGIPEKHDPNVLSQVIIVHGDEGKHFGILIDRLGDVPEVPVAEIADVSSIYVGVTPVLASVVKTPTGSDAPMLTILSVASMTRSLQC